MTYDEYIKNQTDKWAEEETIAKKALSAPVPAEEDPYSGIKRMLASDSRQGIPLSKQAATLRSYELQLEALKDQYQGLNIPTGFFEEQAKRIEKPFGIHQAGSLDRLRQQGDALKITLQRMLNDNFGISYDVTRDMGWEELLKELLRRLK